MNINETIVVWCLVKGNKSHGTVIQQNWNQPKNLHPFWLTFHLFCSLNSQASFPTVTFLNPHHFWFSPTLHLSLLIFFSLSLSPYLLISPHSILTCLSLIWKEIDLNERHHWINAFQQTFLIWGLLTVLYPKSPHGSQRNDDNNKKENIFFTLKFFWVLSRMVKLTEKMIRMTRMTYSARGQGLTTFFFIHRYFWRARSVSHGKVFQAGMKCFPETNTLGNLVPSSVTKSILYHWL